MVLCIILALSLNIFGESGLNLRLATTTSTENSGLLSYILPEFTKQTGITMQTIAVGTGMALKYGEDGEVDVVMVHAKQDEEKFIAAGFGIDRREFMYNDFVIVGPENDPAKAASCTSTVQVLGYIEKHGSPFISRGDKSGTHKKEESLWESAHISPKGSWYIEAGQGMEQVLIMASEKQAYTLADRGTLIAVEDKLKLKIVFSGDQFLFNQYGVIAVNPKRHSHVKIENARKFIDWLTSPSGQDLIASFKINGKQLFYPNALTKE